MKIGKGQRCVHELLGESYLLLDTGAHYKEVVYAQSQETHYFLYNCLKFFFEISKLLV